MAEPRYPDVTVELVAGNALVIIADVRGALKQHLRDEDVPIEERNEILAEFFKEATSGGYDELLQTCMKWVNVE